MEEATSLRGGASVRGLPLVYPEVLLADDAVYLRSPWEQGDLPLVEEASRDDDVALDGRAARCRSTL